MIQPVNPGDQVSARKLNEIIAAVNRAEVSVAPPLEKASVNGRTLLRLSGSNGFWAEITGVTDLGDAVTDTVAGDCEPAVRYLYAWREVVPQCDGTAINGAGAGGTTVGLRDAWEANDQEVPVGSLVWMRGANGRFVFSYGATGSVVHLVQVTGNTPGLDPTDGVYYYPAAVIFPATTPPTTCHVYEPNAIKLSVGHTLIGLMLNLSPLRYAVQSDGVQRSVVSEVYCSSGSLVVNAYDWFVGVPEGA